MWKNASNFKPDIHLTVICYFGDHVPCDIGIWNGKTWQRANDNMEDFDLEPIKWHEVPEIYAR